MESDNGRGAIANKWICLYLRHVQKTSTSVAKKRLLAMTPREKLDVMLLTEQWMKETGQTLEARGRPLAQEPKGNKAYSVNLPIRDIGKLKQKSEESGESVSVLIRAAVRQFLEAGR